MKNKHEFIKKYEAIWGDNPSSLMINYNYMPGKTNELDNMDASSFNRGKLYEMVLWKLNRFPEISDDLIEQLKSISTLKPREHRKAKNLIRQLLLRKGVALPMASTIFRFLNPHVFQIIDDRTFRVLFADQTKYHAKPTKVSDKYLENTIETYFNYLDELHCVSCEKLPFEMADRILYQLDISLENRIRD